MSLLSQPGDPPRHSGSLATHGAALQHHRAILWCAMRSCGVRAHVGAVMVVAWPVFRSVWCRLAKSARAVCLAVAAVMWKGQVACLHRYPFGRAVSACGSIPRCGLFPSVLFQLEAFSVCKCAACFPVVSELPEQGACLTLATDSITAAENFSCKPMNSDFQLGQCSLAKPVELLYLRVAHTPAQVVGSQLSTIGDVP